MTRWRQATGVGAVVAAGLSLAGCVMGPDFKPPPAPPVASFTPGGDSATPVGAESPQHLAAGADIPARWWSLFHSAELDALVRAAIANNQDLKAAQAALRQNQELLYAQRGAFLPTAGASFQASRARNSNTLAPPLSDNSSVYNLYTPQVTISYAPDVFGATRRAVEGAAAQRDAQAAQVEATYLTIAANVVQAALQRASLLDQIEAAQAAVDDEQKLTAILRRQRDLGQVSSLDVAAQESALAQAQSVLPPLRKQAAQELDVLSALLGRYPQDAPGPRLRLADLTLPADIPVGLPSALVSRRPDIRVAEANLHAASAQIGVAAAARLPSLTLSANLGSAAEAISRLARPDNRFWDISAGLAQPIYQGGALLHRQRAAQAAYDQAAAQYRSTVLLAFQNVADALQALREDAAAMDAADGVERSAATTLRIARRQLEVGEISGLNLLNAEQAYAQARQARIQALTARFTDTAALFQALGANDWAAVAASSDPHARPAAGAATR